MTPVAAQTIRSQKGEPTCRAISAETMKMPEPIIDPATIMVASNRDRSRTTVVARSTGAVWLIVCGPSSSSAGGGGICRARLRRDPAVAGRPLSSGERERPRGGGWMSRVSRRLLHPDQLGLDRGDRPRVVEGHGKAGRVPGRDERRGVGSLALGGQGAVLEQDPDPHARLGGGAVPAVADLSHDPEPAVGEDLMIVGHELQVGAADGGFPEPL